MEALRQVFDWFGAQVAAPIEHAVLGTLRYKDNHWQTSTLATPVPILIPGDYRGPKADLVVAAVRTIEDLPSLDTRAQAYLASIDTEPLPALTLIAVTVSVPYREWVEKELTHQHPHLARLLLDGAPIVALQYAIEGDHNVVDAIFVMGTACAWEYH